MATRSITVSGYLWINPGKIMKEGNREEQVTPTLSEIFHLFLK